MEKQHDWAEYKRNERGHAAGDHSRCGDNNKCDAARELYVSNQLRLMCLAILAELKKQHISARKFLGDDVYAATVKASKASLPDYAWLQAAPDFVHEIEARVRIKSGFTDG